ncbi:GNAT family N-acetyltransferase [Sphingomonas sinipercae]|uniref:GNAT family N-acetyltransferase n=1 Tax=Sphingomonas sinipercae TaxID=2714944 RepID=A0A6G7ZPV7_9SPHN|nr:GNAT family N-acetyltransferase [Sphingomonas sinipercae]QIL02952.1 GNAT family N-acetyltransferase [Sphingomonas sinipercae]
MAVEPHLLETWCRLWSRSRNVEPPVWDGDALRTWVGEAGQSERWVFGSVGPGLVALTRTIADPNVQVKVCASAAEVRALIPSAWRLGTPRFFMTAQLRRAEAACAPAGNRIELADEDWGWKAMANDPDGVEVGRAGLLIEGGLAVIDRLVVDDAHRGRGLAAALVDRLQAEAVRRGATEGALVATAAGRPVYARQGWGVVSDYTTCSLGR